MRELSGQTVTIAGAGVLGLAAAFRLAEAGARVRVCDPAAPGDNASGVAAGMLAPAFETALDGEGAERLALLARARDLWPGLLAAVGAPAELIDRSGALLAGFAGEEKALAEVAARLRGLGVCIETLGGEGLRRLQPGLSPAATHGVFCGEDWRLPPAAVLDRLRAAVEARGGRFVSASVGVGPDGLRIAGERADGPVVLAAGHGAEALAALAGELSVLSPVKGQILHFAAPPVAGATVRSLAGYVAPQPGGAVAGATMEPGRRDRAVEPETLAALRERAARLFPDLAEAPAVGRAGVRAATPDGLPLVGRAAGRPGLILAVGARRNGWLVAPLVAEAVVRAIAGAAPDPAFDPARFG